MKAISLWQPWASLWLSTAKVHETRHWSTRHRGILAVHAAKKYDHESFVSLKDITERHLGRGFVFPLGAIIGTVNLIHCLRMSVTTPASDDDRECGYWSSDRYAWARGRYQAFKTPIPFIGRQRLFNVPDEIIKGAS